MRRLLIILLFFLAGCKSPVEKSESTYNAINTLRPKYAKGFEVVYYNGFKVINVKSNNKVITQYIIYPIANECPKGFETAIKISNSIDAVVLLSTSQVAAVTMLNKSDKVVGIANSKMIFNELINQLLNNGKIQDVGADYEPNIDKVVRLKPSLLFTDGEYTTQGTLFDKLSKANVSIVKCQDYKETSPLARAEWIRFYGAIFDKQEMADSIFAVVERNYLFIKINVKTTTVKPSTFCNYPYLGIWYLPAKGNYTTTLFEDAGANYIWRNDHPNNGLNVSLNFEQVLKRAKTADSWILFSGEKNRSELVMKDEKLTEFDAFKNKKVYSASLRVSEGKGIDYWETGIYRPDWALSDLVSIFHPEMNDSIYTPHFFKVLE
jgi:iron complex transport system substrate-binding protein